MQLFQAASTVNGPKMTMISRIATETLQIRSLTSLTWPRLKKKLKFRRRSWWWSSNSH